MKVTIHTDGSSRGNPGRGGWGAIIMTPDEVIEMGGKENMTTNNRMELSGALFALKEIGDHIKEVEVFTDSQYVQKGMTTWITGWIKNGWKGSTKKPVLNQDLWMALKKEEDRLKDDGVKVSWTYVRGHNGDMMNERADVIATACADLPAGETGASNLQLYRGPRVDYLL